MNAFIIHNRYLHIYEGLFLKVAIKAPDPILDFVLCMRHLREERLQEWRVMLLTSSHCVYQADIPRDMGNEEAETCDAGESSSNLTIFSDLLDQEGCGLINVSTAADSVIRLESKHIILHTDGLPTQINLVGNILLVLLSDVPNKIRAYNLDGVQTVGPNRKHSAVFELVCPSLQFDTNMDKHGLYVVTSDGYGDGWMSTDTVILPPTLFAAIFNSEAALLQSEVILYTLNGCVFYHQMKALSQSGDTWDVLSNIEGSVESILPVQWQPKDNETDFPFAALQSQSSKCNSGLLVCSSTGSTIYLYQCPEGSRLVFDIIPFPGPVVSCKVDKTCVYHCTGKRMYKHVINMIKKDRSSGSTSSGRDKSACLETELLHESRVNSFAVATENGDDRLLCQSPSGEIMTLSAQKETGNSEHTQGTHSFKELLTGLNNNNAKLSEIQDKQKHINEFLQQLSVAGHLLSRKSDRFKQQKAKPVSCTCTVSSVVNGYTREYSLVCKLTNHGPLALSNDWSLMVVMETDHHSGRETRTHGMPLSYGLLSGSSTEVRVALEPRCLSSVYCEVNVSLVLYSDLLGDQESFPLNAPVPRTSSLSLPVPVSSHRLDILHYLHQPIPEVVSAAMPSETRSLSSLARKQPIINQRTDAAQASCHLHSINICVDGVKLPDDVSELVLKADTMDVKVLRYLLKDSQVDLSSISKGQLQLASPSGHLISITVATNPQGPGGEKLEVQLGSERVELLAECRMAVVQRLQAVTCEEAAGVTVEQMREYLAKIEDLKEEMATLEGQQRSRSPASDDLGRLYEKLRKLQL